MKIKESGTKFDLVAAGELLVDLISGNYSRNGLEDSDNFGKFAGGSPANVACNVARQKKSAAFISSVGMDGFGTFLVNHLSSSGVNTDNIQFTDSRPTSLVCVTKSTGNPEFAAYREADSVLMDTELDYSAVSGSKIFHFSAFALSKEPSRSSILRLARHASSSGCVIGFEPNFRAKMWTSEDDPMRYIEEAVSLSSIIKPSEDDAFHIFGKMSVTEYCRKFHEMGAENVVLTLGPEGAVYFNGSEFHEFPSVADEVIDTTGAGDAFWSGMYCALLEGTDMKKAVSAASHFSAFKLRQTGAVADIPPVSEILLRI